MIACSAARRATGLWVALLVSSACQGPALEREERVVTAVQHGHYGEALERARRVAEENPSDGEAQQLYADARLAYVLDVGRTAVFAGNLTRALECFEAAREMAPDHPTVASWIQKTKAQLATHWLDVAAEQTGPEHLGDAEAAYEKALEYQPDNADARDGLARVLLLRNYRGGMSKTYFDDGLSSFRALLLEQARRSFQVSRRYEENEPASTRAQQVEELLAEDRLAQARALEAAGMYFAARNEYRFVLLIDPKNEEGRAGLDRMDRESRATTTLAAAEMEIRRGELDKAETTLELATNLTEAQKDDVSLLQSGIEERRLEDMYSAARMLADDYRYPEAVQAFAALLAESSDYKDARLRKATLEEFIRLAEEFYAKALEATDDAVAEEYLRAIHPVIWPEYKDVVQRLKAIEERKAAAKASEKDEGAVEQAGKEAEEPPKSAGDGPGGG